MSHHGGLELPEDVIAFFLAIGCWVGAYFIGGFAGGLLVGLGVFMMVIAFMAGMSG